MLDEKVLRTIFSRRLRQLRKISGMTQLQVSQLLSLDRSTYAYYETGKTCPAFDTLLRLSQIYNVSTDYLIGADEAGSTVMLHQPELTLSQFLEGAASLSGLSADERAFLVLYRQMDGQQREELLTFAMKSVNPPEGEIN